MVIGLLKQKRDMHGEVVWIGGLSVVGINDDGCCGGGYIGFIDE
jgi:hypothetical protein